MLNSYRTSCVIVDNGGDSPPRPASTIKYKVEFNVQLEDGSRMKRTLENVTPAVDRWPDDLVDTVPAGVNTTHPCAVTEGIFEAFIVERPAAEECVPASGSRGGGRVLLRADQIDKPPGDGGGTGAAGGSGSGDGGSGGSTGSGSGTSGAGH